MLTLRKMFSKSLTSSAAWGDETGTTRSMICAYSAQAISRQDGVTPPTTFGMPPSRHVRLPGSMRSGEKARKNCSPTASPEAAKRGSSTSSVVPG